MRAFPIRSPNFVCHCTTPCLYQPIKKKVSPYLSRFSNYACYKFVTSYARTHARTHAQTNFWITIPRVGLKALELKKKVGRYLSRFLNFAWGQKCDADNDNNNDDNDATYDHNTLSGQRPSG